MCRTSELRVDFRRTGAKINFHDQDHRPAEALFVDHLSNYFHDRVRLSVFILAICAKPFARDQWGAVPVSVSHTNGKWIIAGTKNKMTVDCCSDNRDSGGDNSVGTCTTFGYRNSG